MRFTRCFLNFFYLRTKYCICLLLYLPKKEAFSFSMLEILYIIAEFAVWRRPSTEYTEWHWPLSSVYSIKMEKLAQAGEGEGCTPAPFHYIYHHVQSCGVQSSWEGRYTPPISPLPLYDTLWRPFFVNTVQAPFSIERCDSVEVRVLLVEIRVTDW